MYSLFHFLDSLTPHICCVLAPLHPLFLLLLATPPLHVLRRHRGVSDARARLLGNRLLLQRQLLPIITYYYLLLLLLLLL